MSFLGGILRRSSKASNEKLQIRVSLYYISLCVVFDRKKCFYKLDQFSYISTYSEQKSKTLSDQDFADHKIEKTTYRIHQCWDILYVKEVSISFIL